MGKHVDQYPLVKSNTEAHSQTYKQKDVIFQKDYHPLDSKGYCNLLTIFRLVPEKDIENIINTAYELRKNKIKFIWRILGDGPMFNEFQNLIKRNHLNKYIFLMGNIEHGPKFDSITNQSNIYVLPNRKTGIGIGRSGWEMMAKGLPCIFPPLAERFHYKNGFNCMITKKGLSNEYSELIIELISNPRKAKFISSNSSIEAYRNALEPSIDHIISFILRTIR